MTNPVTVSGGRVVIVGDVVRLVYGFWAIDNGDEKDEVFQHESLMTIVDDNPDTDFYINRDENGDLTIEISALIHSGSDFE